MVLCREGFFHNNLFFSFFWISYTFFIYFLVFDDLVGVVLFFVFWMDFFIDVLKNVLRSSFHT